ALVEAAQLLPHIAAQEHAEDGIDFFFLLREPKARVAYSQRRAHAPRDRFSEKAFAVSHLHRTHRVGARALDGLQAPLKMMAAVRRVRADQHDVLAARGSATNVPCVDLIPPRVFEQLD